MSLAFPIEINILDFIFKGIIIGVIASAPMGPVGILLYSAYAQQGTLVWVRHGHWCCVQ